MKTIGSSYEVGFYHRKKDNSVFPVSLSRSNIKDAKGDDVAIVGVARDISERIRTEDEIRTVSLKLQKKNQMQNEVAIMVAETLHALLANGNVETADRLICDYQDVAAIDAEKIELNPCPFCFTSLVSKTVEAFRPLAMEKSIELKNLTSAEELIVEADYDRMARALFTLLSRAIKSSSPNGHVHVCVKDAGHELSLEIQDDGPPIKRDELHRTVKQPEWIREQLQSGREDLALGLRLSIEFVEMHGGRVWTESPNEKYNKTCFTVPKSVAGQDVLVETFSREQY